MTFQAISSGMPSLWDWLFHCVYYGYRCCSLVGTQLLLVLNLFMLLYKKETANRDRWTTCLLSIHRGPQTQNCPFLLRLMLLFLTTLIVCPSLHNFPIDTQSYNDSPTFSLNTTFVLILYLCPLLYLHFHFLPSYIFSFQFVNLYGGLCNSFIFLLSFFILPMALNGPDLLSLIHTGPHFYRQLYLHFHWTHLSRSWPWPLLPDLGH